VRNRLRSIFSLRVVFFHLSLVFVAIPFWLKQQFGDELSCEQILFHIVTGPQALQGTDSKTFRNALLIVGLLPALITLLTFKARAILLVSLEAARRLYRLVRDLRLPYALQRYWPHVVNTVVVLIFIGASYFLFEKLNVDDYVENLTGEDHFSALYVRPDTESFRLPERPKNLVFIYVESLERAFLDAKKMKKAAKPVFDLEGIEITDFKQAPGTGWSIAGMIASQCGVPLKPYFENHFEKLGVPAYLPGLTCLGDVLKPLGYKSTFIVGADIRFSGMDKFFGPHGYDQVLGKDQFRERGVDPRLFTTWGDGIHDDTLYGEALKLIDQHRRKGELFNLTIKTTDNHGPHGYPSPRCGSYERRKGIVGTFSCTSRQVAEFVDELRRRGELKDTQVVIMGDHLFMTDDEWFDDAFPKGRDIYVKFIGSELPLAARDRFTHFDMPASILDLLGISNPSKSFGLGKSVFAVPESEYARVYQAMMDRSILNESATYFGFFSPTVSKAK